MKKLLLLCLSGVIGFLACQQRSSPKLEFGIIAPAFDWLPLRVADQAGYLKDLPIIYHRFNSGWELGEALIAGKVDIAIIPFTYVAAAVARGSDVRIISCLEHEDDGIIARAGINSIPDLSGKKIGCLKASTIELLLRSTLERAKLTAEIVYFSSPMEMWSALEQGAVDALSYYVPGIIKAAGKIGNIIYWYSDEWPMHPCCDIAVHQRRIAAKQAAVKRLVTALQQATGLIAQDSAYACSVAVTTWNLSDSIARLSLRHTPFRVSLTEDEIAFELKLIQLMSDIGYLPRAVGREELYLKGYAPSEE